MDINTRAAEYAENNVSSLIQNVIKEAYRAGYEDGFAEASKQQAKQQQSEINLGNINCVYVDLDLPSKTLWATDFLKDQKGRLIYFDYNDANEKFTLPTLNQFEELFNYCQIQYEKDFNRFQIIGQNGRRLTLRATGKNPYDKDYFNFIFLWAERDENHEGKPYAILRCFNTHGSSFSSSDEKLPVLLCKQP